MATILLPSLELRQAQHFQGPVAGHVSKECWSCGTPAPSNTSSQEEFFYLPALEGTCIGLLVHVHARQGFELWCGFGMDAYPAKYLQRHNSANVSQVATLASPDVLEAVVRKLIAVFAAVAVRGGAEAPREFC